MTTRPLRVLTSFNMGVGDAIKWHEGDFEFKYGVVTEATNAAAASHVLAQRLQPNTKNNTWEFVESCWERVPYSCVLEHEPIHGDDGNAPTAWNNLGFRMTGPSEFVAHVDEDGECDKMLPVGDPAFEIMSDSDESMGSLKEFIVPDNEAEVFTRATDSGDGFVDSTHESVRAFQAWQPKNEREHGLKRFIEQMEHRAAMLDDEMRMNRGMTAMSYNS